MKIDIVLCIQLVRRFLCKATNEVDPTYVVDNDRDKSSKPEVASDSDDTDNEIENVSLDRSFYQAQSRSGLTRNTQTTTDACVQTSPVQADKPIIRQGSKVCTPAIKMTIAEVSSGCGISVENARKAVFLVCKHLYGHDFYLHERKSNDDNETQIATRPMKKLKVDKDPNAKNTAPKTSDDYEKYIDVLPSKKVVAKYKQYQASEIEKEAAVGLFAKPESIKSTLHFDCTSRKHLDGDWPSLIFNFSDGRQFYLRSLYFSIEDRANIVRLVVETYERLAAAASIAMNVTISAKMMWEKTDCIMTDSVSKNHYIGPLVAKALESNHVPKHLFCKSHTVEALDRANLNTLSQVEKTLELRKKFEEINPSLRSFFRGKKTVM